MADVIFVPAEQPGSPFGTGSVSADAEHPVNVTQLADEICKLSGQIVRVAQIGSRIHVAPAVPDSVLHQAMTDHRIDRDYGLDDLQRERQALLATLISEKEVGHAEIRRALIIALS